MVLWNLESSSVELTYVAATVSFTPVVILSEVCCCLVRDLTGVDVKVTQAESH